MNREAFTVFNRAGMVGLHVVRQCVDQAKDIDAIFEAAESNLKIAADESNLLVPRADQVKSIGDSGFASAETYFGNLFARWQAELTAHDTIYPYIRAGFGFPLGMLNHAAAMQKTTALEAANLEVTQRAVEGFDSIDWDKEFGFKD